MLGLQFTLPAKWGSCGCHSSQKLRNELATCHDPRLSTQGTSIKIPNSFFLITSFNAVGATISSATAASRDTLTLPGMTIGSGLTDREFTPIGSDLLPTRLR